MAKFVAFYQEIRPEFPSFEETIRETLALVLIQPDFLFLLEPSGNERRSLDEFELASRLSYFLNRLDSAAEQQGTLLDHSLVLYGSSNSVTHDNNNYPLILAGGSELGLKHGRYLKFSDQVPMSNLFVTMLNRTGVVCAAFADSTGELNELGV